MSWPRVTVSNWVRFREITEDMLPRSRPDRPTYNFRGQSDVAWGLRPSLARLLDGQPVAQAIETEKAALGEFQAQATLHLPTNIASRTTDTIGWWTLMQHYRAPTRLLDWTFSPYVAAYFAVAQGWGDRGSDGVIWYFSGKNVQDEMEAMGWKLRSEDFSDYSEMYEYFDNHFFQPNPPSRLSIISRRHREERMVAQQGAFTVSPNPLDDHAQVIEQALAGQDSTQFGRLVIPKRRKPDFLHHLRYMNISANSLFPGIDGIGQSVEEMIRLFPPLPPPPPPLGTFVAATSIT